MKTEQALALIADRRTPCVKRARAIHDLERSGMSQAAIAKASALSTVMISHLKTCGNLRGRAARMCNRGEINGDACYSLASAVGVNQEKVLRRAIEISTQRSAAGRKGRRTRTGKITSGDVKQALRQLRANRSPASEKSLQPVGGRQFDVVIERDEEGYYVASVPTLPGCHTQAKSLDELTQRIQEAIKLCLEVEGTPENALEFVGVQRITIAA